MRTAVAAAIAGVLAGTSVAAAPPARILVPGRSLGGLALGATEADVRAAWGTRFGRCRSCRHPTWYFNRRPFEPQGIGIEFRRGRAAAIFTLWRPDGWRSSRGLRLGDPAARIARLHGPVARTECRGYGALSRADGTVTTAFYVVDNAVWGFALVASGVSVCR